MSLDSSVLDNVQFENDYGAHYATSNIITRLLSIIHTTGMLIGVNNTG